MSNFFFCTFSVFHGYLHEGFVRDATADNRWKHAAGHAAILGNVSRSGDHVLPTNQVGYSNYFWWLIEVQSRFLAKNYGKIR